MLAATGDIDAAIQRSVSGLEIGDDAPALVLQIQQSEALGLVIGDALQQRADQRGFSISINVEHPARGPRQAFRRGDGRRVLVARACPKVSEHHPIEGRHAVAEITHTA